MQPERKLEFEMDEWAGCYRENWSGLIVPAAFAHPAKFSRSLVRRIYEHARDEGWLVPGTLVIDPFGGVALGGLDAAWMGAEWVGCELEPKFKALAELNIAAWNERFGYQVGWCRPRILLGDSRKLASVVEDAGLLVSSPPYAGQALGNTSNYADPEKAKADSERDIMRSKSATYSDMRYGTEPGQLGAMKDSGFDLAVSSPPYADSVNSQDHGIDWSKAGPATGNRKRGDGSKHEETLRAQLAYGQESGQLGAMKDGGFNLAVSSPPYVESLASDDPDKRGDLFKDPKRRGDKTLTAEYGTSEGQIGAMRDGGFDLAVSSPPFVDGRQGTTPSVKGATAPTKHDPESMGETAGQLNQMADGGFDLAVSSPPYESQASNCTNNHGGKVNAAWKAGGIAARDSRMAPGYGDTDGNVGNAARDDFWSAARQIVEQTYQVLVPGARAIWVVKGFVRKKQYVDFPDQWRQLCEAVGFKTLHWHNALLVESHGAQERLDGGTDEIETARKSFFRRLAEAHGSPPVNFEVVLCLEKS